MYIYLTTNKINNKKYIGLSCRKSSESKEYLGSGVHLLKALKKYKRINFEKTILEDNITSFEFLCEKEKYYITLYDAVKSPNFYNVEEGGISTSFWNSVDTEYKNEIKLKISNTLKLYYKTNPTSKQIIKNLIADLNLVIYTKIEKEIEKYDTLLEQGKYELLKKYKRKSSYNLWIKDKPNIIQEFKKLYSINTSNRLKKQIYKFDLNGNLICKYESLDEALKYTEHKTKGNLSRTASGQNNYFSGYRWSFSEIANELIINEKAGRKKGTKNSYKINRLHTNIKTFEILIFDKNENLLHTAIGYENAGKFLNLSAQMICKAICNNKNEYKGYIFKKGKQMNIIKYKD